MDNKRQTPKSKCPPSTSTSTSKFRTPTNLNATCMERRGTAVKPFRCGSASKPQRSQTFLDITGIGNQSSLCPAIKSNLRPPAAPLIDYEVECDCLYSDYLEALMKEEIFEDVRKKHEQDMKDQLAIQKDNLHRSKVTLHKINQEVLALEKLEKVDEMMKTLQNNFDSFLQLNNDFDLNNTLEQLLLIFNLSCNKVSVKDVNTIEEQASYDKLQSLLQNCGQICAKIKSSERNMEAVSHLADLMRKYQDLVDCINQKQQVITKTQVNETYKFIKSVSDMYAAREKYNN